MRTDARLLVLMLSAGVLGCETEPDPRYCDGAARPCTDPLFPVCDLVAHACRAATDGSVDMPVGDGMGGACMTSPDCPTATPICRAAMCRACTGPADDGDCLARSTSTPRCDSTTGTCVACRPSTQTTDCSGTTPICATNGSCRKCQLNSECSTGICKSDGSCAAATEIAYVDNGNQPPATCKLSGTHDGISPTTAYCDIQDAVGGTKQYVLVTGEAQAYGALSINNLNITIVGPGAEAAIRATVQGSTLARGIVVTGNSNVVIDGLEVTAAAAGNEGIACSKSTGNISLAVRRSAVHDNNGAGISSSGCAVSVDATFVGPANAGGGIKLTSTQYTITNNFVFNNGTGSSPGFAIDSGSTGTFIFNTIAKNNVTAGVGGIDCGAGAMKLISNSIVWGNSVSGGTQIGPQCMLSNVVTGSGDSKGTMLDPAFVSATDFHLQSGSSANLACCVDKIMNPTTPNADHDIDFSTRPKGAGWDIGGHEVQ